MTMEKLKLFCLPYAGGSAGIYNQWKKNLHQSIQLYPVELSGRGKRFSEGHYLTFDDALNDVCNIVSKELDGTPYIFFGHSMGSLLVYETILRLKKSNFQTPVHAFFSGKCPPHIRDKEKTLHKLPGEELIAEIKKYGGTSPAFFECQELLDIFIPVIRADYRILETWDHYSKLNVFDFNITALGGTEDTIVPINDLIEWKKYTSRQCRIYEFEGGHFFIHEKGPEIASIINETVHELQGEKIA